jgi:hypothetical protein
LLLHLSFFQAFRELEAFETKRKPDVAPHAISPVFSRAVELLQEARTKSDSPGGMEWWKKWDQDYGYSSLRPISPLAFGFLSLPCSSADAESLFSTSANLFTPHRSSLTPAHLNQLTFIQANLHLFDNVTSLALKAKDILLAREGMISGRISS